MRIVIGSDSCGLSYKHNIINDLLDMGHCIVDVGIHDEYYIDYPDIVTRATKELLTGEYERAILISENGIGVALVANKFIGIYAAVCSDLETIQESIVMNNCNLLCLDTRFVDRTTATTLIKDWVRMEFDIQSKYAQITSTIKKIEQDQINKLSLD